MSRRPSPVLSILAAVLCQVLFVSSSAYALGGGPVYPGGGISTTGIYAGVLNGLLSNSLGVFSVTIPRSGAGTGTAVLFRSGIFFNGTINAVADPGSAQFSGILDLEFNSLRALPVNLTDLTLNLGAIFIVTGGGLVTGTLSQATGRFDRGQIRLDGSALVSFTPTLINGTTPPAVDPNLFTPVNYVLIGYKQQEL